MTATDLWSIAPDVGQHPGKRPIARTYFGSGPHANIRLADQVNRPLRLGKAVEATITIRNGRHHRQESDRVPGVSLPRESDNGSDDSGGSRADAGRVHPMAANRIGPIRELLSDANYRNFWIAQVLVFGVNGTVRFAFVWLMVTLTDWSAAEGLIGIAFGLPALVVSVPAGAWSDRVDRRRFFLVWAALGGLAFAVFAAVIAADAATPRSAGIAAAVLGTVLVVMSPNLNAIVPLLVPPDRLVNATALQNGGGQAAGFLGLALGGLLIEWVGNAGSFAMMSLICALAFVLMVPVHIPKSGTPTPVGPEARSGTVNEAEPVVRPGVATPGDPVSSRGSPGGPSADSTVGSPDRSSIFADMMAGMRYGLGREPSRTLLLLALVLGSSFSVMQIAMPRVVEEEYLRDSGAAGLLLGTFGLGMFVSSLLVARRSETLRHGFNVARFIGIGLGMGQFLLSLAQSYWLAMVVMIAWGLNAGVAIASHRTLLQHNTEPAMMGRVMGIMILGFSGGLPFGALAQAVLAPAIGPVLTMRVVGLVTMAITIPLTWRRSIRTA